MKKSVFFISHVTEEAELALTIQEWIESTFSPTCRVFVSASARDLPPGSAWLDEIRGALAESAALFVICSNSSISRPWINFEAGCGWIRGVPVIPLCHSGVTRDSLPQPLSSFQSLELASPNCCEELLKAAAHHLEHVGPLPRIDMQLMRSEIDDALQKIQASRLAATAVVRGPSEENEGFDTLAISTSEVLLVEDFITKIVETSSRRTKYSWRITARNVSLQKTGFSAKVVFQDSEGFKIDDRVCLHESPLSPGEVGQITETKILDNQQAAKVGRLHAILSKYSSQP